MSEVVERVARAMRALVLPLGTHLDQDWKSIGDGARRMYRRDARAAIEAMREPTVEMLVAAQEEWMCVRAAEERGDFIWRAMIDAALSVPSEQCGGSDA